MLPPIYAIAFDRPFLDTFVAGLMRRHGKDPVALARVTVLLPTRRAGRSLREAFLRAGDGAAMLLPKMVPVGDLDPEELSLLQDEGDAGGGGLDLPPAVPELRRHLMLTRLVQDFGKRTGGPITLGQAAPLARELARFLDETHAEGCDLGLLDQIVPEKHAEHWQLVLKFLDIVRDYWPAMLAEIGSVDPAQRRNQLLALQAATWRRSPPEGPVIAAGITGAIPAVADLMAVVATLPHGEIVLPGLDSEADGALWEEIRNDPTNPQHLLAKLLDRLEVEPQQVRPWHGKESSNARGKLLREALAPATLTHRWRFIAGVDAKALKGFRRLDCPGPQEEALAIALMLRERLETPGATAALITPDRDLARRVAAELRRWKIDIDDSAGVPLNKTPPGVFLRLVLELAAEELAPLPLLAALKHPFAACGLSPAVFRDHVRALELETLRGPRPQPGAAGLRDLLPPEAAALRDLVMRLESAIAPLTAALAERETTLSALIEAHIACCEALAASNEEPGPARLWREAAGEAAALFFNDLLQAASDFPPLKGRDYPALFEALLAGGVVRPPYGRHPRLSIWGLLEARLQHADLVVMGGLNEGTWPGSVNSDPWLSRPMRADLQMPPPERRIGAAALDFSLAAGAGEVVMTRAARVEGTPTVPSRWLLRLDAVLRAAGIADVLTDAPGPLAWQKMIDAPAGPPKAIEPPAPTPPVKARPRKLSVTEIETWRRDPYAIYARHVLKLRALDPLDADPGAADRGMIIHDALARFIKTYPKHLPADPVERLRVLGQQCFGDALARPGVWAFWWPRFMRIAEWIAIEEAGRRPLLDDVLGEVDASILLDGPEGPFKLTGRADRIERRRDGTMALIDYKTGSVPPTSDVMQGYAPQLPLEAAMIECGGFAGIAKAAVSELAYWRLSGGDPSGEIKFNETDPAKLRALIDDAVGGLQRLITAFDDPATPYRAQPSPDKAPRYSDYFHLERAKEWMAGKEGEE